MFWDSNLLMNIILLNLFVNRQNLTAEGLTPRSKNGVYRYFNTASVQLLSRVRLFAASMEPARLHCPWGFPGKNTGAGCHFLLQGLFLDLGSNPSFLHWQVDSSPAEPPGKPMKVCTGVSNIGMLLCGMWGRIQEYVKKHVQHLWENKEESLNSIRNVSAHWKCVRMCKCAHILARVCVLESLKKVYYSLWETVKGGEGALVRIVC